MKELNLHYIDLCRYNFRLNNKLGNMSFSGPDLNYVIWDAYCKNMKFDTVIPTDYRDLLNYPILPFKK